MNDEITTPPPVPLARSRFVSVVAWVFIAFNAVFLLNGLLGLIIAAVFMVSGFAEQAGMPHVNQTALTISIAVAEALFWAFSLLVSIGLLRRRPRARSLFMAVLIMNILISIGRPVLMGLYPMAGFTEMRNSIPGDMAEDFEGMVWKIYWAIVGFYVVVAVAITGVCGWLLKRFSSEKIKAEFPEAK